MCRARVNPPPLWSDPKAVALTCQRRRSHTFHCGVRQRGPAVRGMARLKYHCHGRTNRSWALMATRRRAKAQAMEGPRELQLPLQMKTNGVVCTPTPTPVEQMWQLRGRAPTSTPGKRGLRTLTCTQTACEETAEPRHLHTGREVLRRRFVRCARVPMSQRRERRIGVFRDTPPNTRARGVSTQVAA